MLRGRPKLLVLNKMDLADPARVEVTITLFQPILSNYALLAQQDVQWCLHEEGEREVLFTNLRKQHDSTINEVSLKTTSIRVDKKDKENISMFTEYQCYQTDVKTPCHSVVEA